VPSRAHLVVALVLLGGAAGLGVAALRPSAPPPAVAEPAASAPAKGPEHHHHVPPGRSLPPPVTTVAESIERRAAGPSADGALTTLTVTTPPFEITRRYKSMEGPYATIPVRVDGAALPAGGKAPKRELWWWKGARIEMLDEHGAPLDQEFMCHANVDVDLDAGASLGLRRSTPRLVTLTQGELAFSLPEGRGLPVASDETWSLMFQVLNHNRDGVFRVKQRLVLTFVRDADRAAPIAAVEPYAGSIWVPLEEAAGEPYADEAACPCCAPPAVGVEAASNVRRFVDDAGFTLAGHWVVPPGRHTWSYPLVGGLGRPRPDKRIFATWTHVHPFATEVRLLAHDAGSCGAKVVTTTTIDSLTDGRVGLATIRSLSSAEGIPVPAAGSFEIAVAYDNPTGRAQDSMTSLGVYASADDFTRPAWAR
jgi:hypothetical protein